MRSIATYGSVILLLATTAVRGSTPYTLVDLGTLGGTWSYAVGINNSGQVVGSAFVSSDSAGHAFRTAANQVINPATDDLGTLGGNYSEAWSINDNGQVVGMAATSGGNERAFRTAANQPMNPAADDLGTFGGRHSYAYGINNSGQVAGIADTSGGPARAFRTGANQAISPATDNLGTLGGGESCARAINNSGHVVGVAIIAGNSASHAFRTAANQAINPATDDLGTLGGNYSEAWDINNSGQVVGQAATSGDTASHAFCTASNQPINSATDDLGTFGGSYSFAFGINNCGTVVGAAYTTGDASLRAFLYSGSGPIHDLNDLISPASGWTIVEARAVNDLGQIVGYGRNAGGQGRAVLLNPSPEPSIWTSPGIGSWNDWQKWTGGVPNAIGAGAAFNRSTTADLTVALDRPQTIGTLQFGNSVDTNVGYKLSGSGANQLIVNNSGSGATIAVTDGRHVIAAPVVLNDDLQVTGSNSGWTLSFSVSSAITGSGRALTMCGEGTLVLGGSNTYTGGTAVAVGTLIVASSTAILDGTDVTVGDGSLFLAPIVPASGVASAPAAAVPEPSTLALLGVGALGLLGFGWRRGRSSRGASQR